MAFCFLSQVRLLFVFWPVLYYNEDDESGQQPSWKGLMSWALQPDLAHFPALGTGNAISGLFSLWKKAP